MASQLLYATNRLTFLMWSSLLEGVIKIVLSLLLVKPWGLAGVAVSNLIPMVLFEGVAIPIYLFRRYPIPLAGYLRDVLGRSLLVGAAIYIVGAALVSIHAPTSWIAFLAEISAASLAGLAAAAASGALQSAQAERS
jgi:O-antigen/teichoic acid export membrane protein